jgi:hypothetical protein
LPIRYGQKRLPFPAAAAMTVLHCRGWQPHGPSHHTRILLPYHQGLLLRVVWAFHSHPHPHNHLTHGQVCASHLIHLLRCQLGTR